MEEGVRRPARDLARCPSAVETERTAIAEQRRLGYDPHVPWGQSKCKHTQGGMIMGDKTPKRPPKVKKPKPAPQPPTKGA